MFTTINPLRRFGAALAIAGAAALGSVVVAPAASAAQPLTVENGPAAVAHTSNGNGPDAFVVLEHGKSPVFYCEADKPKQKKNCLPVETDGPRF